MIIGFDIDDTIADTYETFYAYAQKFIIEDLKRELEVTDSGEITHSYHYAEMHNLSQEENNAFLQKYLEQIFKEAKPKILAKEYIQKLHDEGNEIVLITSRLESKRTITEQWLEENRIIYDKLIMHCESKKNAIKENNIEVFVDDNLEYCKQALDTVNQAFIMDTRPNRNLETGEIKRIYSYPHLYEECRKKVEK